MYIVLHLIPYLERDKGMRERKFNEHTSFESGKSDKQNQMRSINGLSEVIYTTKINIIH